MDNEWKPGTVYLKTTSDEGHVAYTEHFCWNTDRFVRFTHQAMTDAGGKAEQVTEAEYRSNR